MRPPDDPGHRSAENEPYEEESNCHPSPLTIGRGSDGTIGAAVSRPEPQVVLGLLALRAGFCGLVPLLLCHVFVLGGTILGGTLPLLRGAFAAHRRVAHQVSGRFFTATEELVE
jgi:hypothetical protein